MLGHGKVWAAGAAAIGLGTSVAGARQAGVVFSTGFESPPYVGTVAGTALTGQEGWYAPAVAGNLDAEVYRYPGNDLGLHANPIGGAQFIGGRAMSSTAYVRTQHTIDFTVADRWTIAFDVNARYDGVLPAVINNSVFTLHPSATSRFWQTRTNLMDNSIANSWKIQYAVLGAAGGAVATLKDPGPEWTNLNPLGWYRLYTTFDFAQNRILSVAITDLFTGQTTTKAVGNLGWYLGGGANSTLARPTDVRIMVTGNAGQKSGYDNLTISTVCYPDCTGDGALNVSDYICFQTRFALGDANSDCNYDGALNVNDFICFQTAFSLGCE